MKKLIEIPDKYQRANNIAKTVRSLQRVPEKERPRIVNKAVFNIYVIGSAVVLFILWLYFFAEDITNIQIGNHITGGRLSTRKAHLFMELLVPVFIPAVFILGVPLLIRNYIIKRLVDKEYPKEEETKP